jgi:3-phosphoglycerate kinase
MEKAKQKNVAVHLPVDFVVGDEFKESTPHVVIEAKAGIPQEKMVKINLYLPN